MTKKEVKPAFDLTSPPQTVRMGRARFVHPVSGQATFVISDLNARQDAKDVVYNPTLHANHLCCEQCAAEVNFRAGDDTAVSGSSLKGRDSSFVTAANERHVLSCDYYTDPKPSRTPSVINKEKGFRVHINTAEFSDLYTQVEGVYRRKGAILEILDEDLKDREIYKVKSVEDLVKFMTTQNPARVKDSALIFGNVRVDWPDFLIRYNRKGNNQPRFIGLVERLQGEGKGAQSVCLMEMQIKKRHTFSSYEKNLSVYSRPVPYLTDNKRQRRDIMPSATLDRMVTRHNTHMQSLFNFDEPYLVLGIATLKDDGEGSFFLNMKINDTRQVLPVNIENVARQAALKQNAAAPSSPDSGPN